MNDRLRDIGKALMGAAVRISGSKLTLTERLRQVYRIYLDEVVEGVVAGIAKSGKYDTTVNLVSGMRLISATPTRQTSLIRPPGPPAVPFSITVEWDKKMFIKWTIQVGKFPFSYGTRTETYSPADVAEAILSADRLKEVL